MPICAPQRRQRRVTDVDAVDQDGASGDVVKARQQVDQRGLAGAAAPDDRDHLSGAHGQRHVAQDRRCRIFVTKVDVAEFDGVLEWRERSGAGQLEHLGVGVQHLEDALGRRGRLLQVGVDAAQLLGGAVHQKKRADEGDEIAGRQMAFSDLRTSINNGGRHADAAEQFHQRRQARQRSGHLHVGAVQVIAGAAEFLGLQVLGAECLDDAVAGECFRAQVRNLFERFLAPARGAAHALPQSNQRIHDERRAGEADDRQPGVVPEEQARIADQRQCFPSQIARSL